MRMVSCFFSYCTFIMELTSFYLPALMCLNYNKGKWKAKDYNVRETIILLRNIQEKQGTFTKLMIP